MKTLSEFLNEDKQSQIEIINEARKIKLSSDDYNKLKRLKRGTKFAHKNKTYMIWFDTNNPYATKTVALLTNPDLNYDEVNSAANADAIKGFYELDLK